MSETKTSWNGKGWTQRPCDHDKFGENYSKIKKTREFNTSSFKMTVNGKPVPIPDSINGPQKEVFVNGNVPLDKYREVYGEPPTEFIDLFESTTKPD